MKARIRSVGKSRPAIGSYIYNKVEHKPLYIIRYRDRYFTSSYRQISRPYPSLSTSATNRYQVQDTGTDARESVKKISMTFVSFSHFKRPFREALTGPVQPANEVRQNRKIGASAKEYTCKGKRIYMKRQSSIMLERQVTIGYFAKYPMVTFPKIQAFCNTLIFNILQGSR